MYTYIYIYICFRYRAAPPPPVPPPPPPLPRRHQSLAPLQRTPIPPHTLSSSRLSAFPPFPRRLPRPRGVGVWCCGPKAGGCCCCRYWWAGVRRFSCLCCSLSLFVLFCSVCFSGPFWYTSKRTYHAEKTKETQATTPRDRPTVRAERRAEEVTRAHDHLTLSSNKN